MSMDPISLVICKRSGQQPADCGRSACEYGCDEEERLFLPAPVREDDLATVLLIAADGEVLSKQVCHSDSYVITTGPRLYIHHIQTYSSGTVMVTIKRRPK